MSERKFALSFLPLALTLTCALAAHAQTATCSSDSTKDSEILASVAGHQITQREVEELIGAQLHALRERIYTLRKQALENLIIKIVLEKEAKAAGISVEQVKGQLVPQKVEVTEADINEAYMRTRNDYAGLNEDEAKQKIRIDLEARRKFEGYRAALNQLKEKFDVKIFLREPKPPKITVSEGSPVRGPKDAPVTIVEFGDFECPYCRRAAPTLQEVLSLYPAQVKVVYKHPPPSRA